jgi:hypothetical protein
MWQVFGFFTGKLVRETWWWIRLISSQIGPKSNRVQSNRPQLKSASSQIGPKSNRQSLASSRGSLYVVSRWTGKYSLRKNILSQLCMQHATYFTFSLWTALKCLFKFLRFGLLHKINWIICYARHESGNSSRYHI